MAKNTMFLAAASVLLGSSVDPGTLLAARDQVLPSGLEMVNVEGGNFVMGGRDEADDGAPPEVHLADECPHPVSLQPYSIGRYEVTQADWEQVTGGLPSGIRPCPDCPISNVSWNDAQRFIDQLNLITGESYRLPTEAEWEYAARGGALSEDHRFAGSDRPTDVGWFEANSEGRLHPVGTLRPNELGLHDMSGNAWEWTSGFKSPYPCDWAGRSFDSAVLRGGSYSHRAHNLRARDRNARQPDTRLNTIGFRLAR